MQTGSLQEMWKGKCLSYTFLFSTLACVLAATMTQRTVSSEQWMAVRVNMGNVEDKAQE